MSKKKDLLEFLNRAEKVNKNQILVLEEFESLIPPLSEEEFFLLESSILAEGCREPLMVWKKTSSENILIDGHNRYKICQKHKIEFAIEIKNFDTQEQVYEWVINNQLGRRNLKPEQAAYLRGKKYHAEKLAIGQRTDLLQKLQKVESVNEETNLLQKLQKVEFANEETNLLQKLQKVEHTHKRLAENYGVSARTISNDAQFSKGIDLIGKENPELKKEILSGKVKINKNQIQALAKLESFPKIESLDQIADILQADKPAKKQVKTDLEIAKEKITKILKEMNLSAEQKQNLKEFLANYPLF